MDYRITNKHSSLSIFKSIEINASVPQGSVLSPTLFLIFTNILLSARWGDNFHHNSVCIMNNFLLLFTLLSDNKPHSSRPVLLNCGHNICENCIYQHRHNLTCAVCLIPIELEHTRWLKKSYDLNFCLLGQLVNSKSFLSSETSGPSGGYVPCGMFAQESFVQKCSECEQAIAIGLCMNCKVDFCKRCFTSVHQNSKVLKKHKLTEFEMQTLQLQLPKERFCKSHKRLCDKFCLDCQRIFCSQCIRITHGTHRVNPLTIEVSVGLKSSNFGCNSCPSLECKPQG